MMVRLGNFLFHYRNGLFPVAYLLLFAKRGLLVENYLAAAAAGFGIALLGQALRGVTVGFEYIIRGGRNRQVYAEKLVMGGMFAHCRNPLYLGNYLIIVGLGVASNSVVFLAAGLPLFALFYRAIIAAEENYLRGKFGAEFDEYCARVNRLLPHLAGFSTSVQDMRYNWRRLLTAEYGTVFAWCFALIAVTLQNVWLAGDYPHRPQLVWTLYGLAGAAVLAYAVARYLKKSGRVRG